MIRSFKKKNKIAGLLFISPWLIGFLILIFFPVITSLVWSFCDYDLLSSPEPAGLTNYTQLSQDPRFYKALTNTLVYAVCAVPLGICVSMLLALLLNQKVRGIAVYRTLFYLPSIVPVVASSILWIWLFDPTQGLINYLLKGFGISGINWLQSPFWSKPALVIMSLWGSGNFMLIYLAALQEIPETLYEAAAIDGAGRWQRIRYITVPSLTPVIFFNLIMGLIESFQYFSQVYVVTNGQGGPLDSTLFFSLYLFQSAFHYLEMGYASAMAWVLFLLIFGLTIIFLKTSKHWVHYTGRL